MKKILSILMAAAMLMTLCVIGISAADEPTMTVSTASAERGQTVSVDVVVSGNPGMNAAALKPVYDNTALELVSMKFNTELFGGSESIGTRAVWANMGGDSDANGVFLTMTFKVLDDAKAGKSVVTVECNDGDACNQAEQAIVYTVVNGAVNVVDPNAPMMNVSTVYGLPGDEVSVTVSLANNPGIAAAALKPVYDNTVLELVSMKFNTELFGGSESMGVKAVWANMNGDSDANGEFLTLKFKVLDGAEGSTVVSVTYDAGDICDFDENDVMFVVNDGAVIFDTEPVPDTEPDTTAAEPDDTTAAPSVDDTTAADGGATKPTAPQTADAGIAVAAIALAAAACFVATKKRK